jgi:hypothetical protein
MRGQAIVARRGFGGVVSARDYYVGLRGGIELGSSPSKEET